MNIFLKGYAMTERTRVYFVGAGSGDPELITVKGRKLLDAADVVIYTGSLVNPALLEGIKAEIHDSAGMTLDQIIDLIRTSCVEDKSVIRLHTGDPSFYGAISEQIERLRTLNIEYEVVPGVSSAMAGAAMLGQELTIPEISQTVIFTRIEGRTPVPEKEKLSGLAKHQATIVIFLSVGMIEKVRDELLTGYPDETPVIVIEKVSWPEERIIRGTLKNIAALVKEAGIKKTALIYVGEALRASEEQLEKESKLYSKDFRHEFRNQ
jgi:precorrin-4/cobalt-precorrin-4 C11-methyltransferase